MRTKQGNDNLLFGALFWEPLKRFEIGYRVVTKRLASNAFLLPPSTIDSNDKNLRNILELLKPPGKSFAPKVINFGVVNVHTKI